MDAERSGRTGPEPDYRLISPQGGETATSGVGNKIITHDGKTHVAWLDATEAGYFAQVRTLDRATGEWSPTFTLGTATDDHGRPAMTMDSRGYLHVVFGVHHDQVPYRRSLRPNDASEWTPTVTFGGDMTYPALVCGADDTLYMAGRSRWEGSRLYAKPPDGDWEDRGLIIRTLEGCFSYAAYHPGLAWGPDHRTVHLSTSTYQSKTTESNLWGTIQSANYMRSTDGGATWERADGTPIPLPATSETMDVLVAGESAFAKPGIRNQGAIVVDSTGRPFVLYIHYNMPRPGQVFLVTPDRQGRWQHLPLQAALDEHWPQMAVIDCRAGFSITEDDTLCIALTLIPREHPPAERERKAWRTPHRPEAQHSRKLEETYYLGLPCYSTNPENARISYESANTWCAENPARRRIAWLESRDGGRTFTARDVIGPDPRMPPNQPSLERPTGFHLVASGTLPGMIYSVLTAGSRSKRSVMDHHVYWADAGSPRGGA